MANAPSGQRLCRWPEGDGKNHGLGGLRAVGLFLGQDIVDEKRPDAKAGDRQPTAREGVLISATGPKGHVLKIRPPMVFSRNVAFSLSGWKGAEGRLSLIFVKIRGWGGDNRPKGISPQPRPVRRNGTNG
jgi:hypothetical protein